MLYEESKNIKNDLVTWRRELHKIPEIGLNLPKTVAFITAKLDERNVEYEVQEDISTVVATIGSGETCFLLRSDTDALPIKENAQIDYASENENMHACGHDLHTTILLGAAKILKAHESELKGRVKLFFQSGEETFNGAVAAIEAGVFDDVDAAFGMHVLANKAVGTIFYGDIPMAANYGFKITITGRGGHGSQPEACIDPITAGVEIYHALQSLIARERPSKESAALTIGQFQAGNAANVIPETAVLQGTLRTFAKETRELLVRRINEIVPAVGMAYRCKVEIEELCNLPSLVCDKKMNELFAESIAELGALNEINGGFQMMASDDFGHIAEKVPSTYFYLGAGVEDESKWLGLHNPEIQFNEECLPIGAAVYAKAAMAWLENN